MGIIDHIIGVVAPHSCLGCGYEGALLCRDCLRRLPAVPPRCYHCRQASVDFRTCQNCRAASQLHAVYTATVYDGPAKDMVWQLKFQGAQTAARIMARQMNRVLVKDNPACVVPVPTATSRVRRRGYDQARLLARQLARHSRLPYVEVLKRQGQAHQVGANQEQRLRQLQNAFRACNLSVVRGRRLILVDDVVTTGATLEAAASVLRAAGARRVDSVVFAQPHHERLGNHNPK